MDRKVVLVDLDNVVYPWAEVMATLVAGNGLGNHTPEDLMKLYQSWNVWDDWAVPQGGFDFIWEKAIASGAMWGAPEGVYVPPLPRAIRGLWALSDAEWHIHLVTHRLNKFRLHDAAVQNTAEWLRKFNIPYRGLSFTEDKHLILGDVIIDDNPNNLIGHPAPLKVLYPAPHNREWRDDPMSSERELQFIVKLQEGEGIYPWDEIVELLGSGVRA